MVSKPILEFHLRSDVQFPSSKRKNLVVQTICRHIVHATTTRLVLATVKPGAINLVPARSILLVVTLVSIILVLILILFSVNLI